MGHLEHYCSSRVSHIYTRRTAKARKVNVVGKYQRPLNNCDTYYSTLLSIDGQKRGDRCWRRNFTSNRNSIPQCTCKSLEGSRSTLSAFTLSENASVVVSPQLQQNYNPASPEEADSSTFRGERHHKMRPHDARYRTTLWLVHNLISNIVPKKMGVPLVWRLKLAHYVPKIGKSNKKRCLATI